MPQIYLDKNLDIAFHLIDKLSPDNQEYLVPNDVTGLNKITPSDL